MNLKKPIKRSSIMNYKALLGVCIAGLITYAAQAQYVDTILATNAISEPMGVVATANGDLYISASANNRIMKYTLSGKLSVLAGSSVGTKGYSNSVNGVNARFYSPQGIIAARGGLVVSDSGNNVLRLVSFSGAVSTLAGVEGILTNSSLIDNGQSTTDKAVPASKALFNSPVGMAMDTDGNIYIADAGNNAIRVLYTNNTVGTLVMGLFGPSAVSVGNNGQIWVADTRNNVVRLIQTVSQTDDQGIVTRKAVNFNPIDSVVAGNQDYLSGVGDSENSLEAFLNGPRGIFWMDEKKGLYFCDSGNQVIRRLFTNEINGGYSTILVAGQYGSKGKTDGEVTQSQFGAPGAIVLDQYNNRFLVVDRENNAIRSIQLTAPLPPIPKPRIGEIQPVVTLSGDIVWQLFEPARVNNNDVIIGIDRVEEGVETYFTISTSPVDVMDTTIPPDPVMGLSSSNNIKYTIKFIDGQYIKPESLVNLISQLKGLGPKITIKAQSFADGRKPSEIAKANFYFRTDPVIIQGINTARIPMKCDTINASIYWTTNADSVIKSDGLDNVNAANIELKDNIINYVPTNLTTISFPLKEGEVTLFARSFAVDGFQVINYAPSEIVSNKFYASNSQPNILTFGFEAGLASSKFIAAPGQSFSVPVTMSLLPGQSIYTLQFNIQVTNNNGLATDLIDAAQCNFKSTLLTKGVPRYFFLGDYMNPDFNYGDDWYYIIPPSFYEGYGRDEKGFEYVYNPGQVNPGVIKGLGNIMLIGWLERSGSLYQNLYDTKQQHLLSYSFVHNTLFTSGTDNKAVVGAYSLKIPKTATTTSSYKIVLGRPSATSDGVDKEAYIEVPTNGVMKGIANVVLGEREYIVGDILPVRWYNAGDFGDSNILNADVLQVFQAGVTSLKLFTYVDAQYTNWYETNITTVGGVTYTNVRSRTEITGYTTNTYVPDSPYNVNVPPRDSDLFDAMDSCCVGSNGIPLNFMYDFKTNAFVTGITNVVTNQIAAVTNITTDVVGGITMYTTNVIPAYVVCVTNIEYLPADAEIIDQSVFGDGVLNVNDIYVTFIRSLDPSRIWYSRYWPLSNTNGATVGNRHFKVVRNHYRNIPNADQSTVKMILRDDVPTVKVTAGDVEKALGGDIVRVPINALLPEDTTLKVFWMSLYVQALDGAPPILDKVIFEPTSSIGIPSFAASAVPGHFAGSWLNPSVQGISQSGLLGNLRIKLPSGATVKSAYAIRIVTFSGSPNGIALYKPEVIDGLINYGSRIESAYTDGIPDSWRLKYFGTVSNLLSQASADADGDGVSNWMEYKSGTNPNNAGSKLKLIANKLKNTGKDEFILRWPTVAGKKYIVEMTTDLCAQTWLILNSGITGDGLIKEFVCQQTPTGSQFYRVRIVE